MLECFVFIQLRANRAPGLKFFHLSRVSFKRSCSATWVNWPNKRFHPYWLAVQLKPIDRPIHSVWSTCALSSITTNLHAIKLDRIINNLVIWITTLRRGFHLFGSRPSLLDAVNTLKHCFEIILAKLRAPTSTNPETAKMHPKLMLSSCGMWRLLSLPKSSTTSTPIMFRCASNSLLFLMILQIQFWKD